MRTDNTVAMDYRPETWREVVGQPEAVKLLQHYAVSGKRPKAILFTGRYGSGKTCVARLFAKTMCCTGRLANDPEPCCECDACISFVGSVWVPYITYWVRPEDTIEHVKSAVWYTALGGTVWYDCPRPPPLLIDDMDEVKSGLQNLIADSLGWRWCGSIVAMSAAPHRIDNELRSRLTEIPMATPTVRDLVPWIIKLAQRMGITTESRSENAASIVALKSDRNYRSVLKVLQHLQHSGKTFTPADAILACAMAGYP